MTKEPFSHTPDDVDGSLLQILPLFLIFFLMVMDYLVMIPLGPDISKHIGLAPEYSGYLIAVYPLFSAISALILAPFSDRWGRKKMLVVLSAGFCLATFGCAFSFNVVSMLTFRILSGIFGGPIMPNLMAYTGDLFHGEKRTKAITAVMLAFATSSILGVPFGAWIGERFSWETAFFIIGTAAFFSILGLMKIRSVGTGIKQGKIFSQYVELFQLWTIKEVRKLFYIRIFMTVGMFGLMPNIGIWLTLNMGMNATEIGLCYMQGGIGAVLGIQLSAWLARVISRPAVISLGCIFMGVVMLLFTNLTFPGKLAGIFLAGLMFGGSMRMPAFQLIMTEAAPIYLRGRLMSMIMIVGSLSMGLGGLWATPLLTIENGKLQGVPLIGGITFLTLLAVIPLVYSLRKHPVSNL